METAQEVFDFVCDALREQGGPSILGKRCLYRSENGRKCAAGHLIPDDKYKRALEDIRVTAKTVSDILGFGDWGGDGIKSTDARLKIVASLQAAHDNHATSWRLSYEDAWPRDADGKIVIVKELEFVAKDHDLNPAVLEKWV